MPLYKAAGFHSSQQVANRAVFEGVLLEIREWTNWCRCSFKGAPVRDCGSLVCLFLLQGIEKDKGVCEEQYSRGLSNYRYHGPIFRILLTVSYVSSIILGQSFRLLHNCSSASPAAAKRSGGARAKVPVSSTGRQSSAFLAQL